jgi:hypothetical protein
MRVPSPRALRFLPLVFLVGIDGFAMFAPYVLAVLVVAYSLRKLRPASAAAVDESESLPLPA